MINPIYLRSENLERMYDNFREDQNFPSITLHDFFTPPVLQKLHQQCTNLEYERSYLATSHSYHQAELPDMITSLSTNDDFLRILQNILDQSVIDIEGKTLQLQWRDYEILHDEMIREPGIDLIIDVTPAWNESLGGSVVYTDGEGMTVTIPPEYGSVTVVDRKKELQYFIKYINNHAQDLSRFLIIAELQVEN